MNEKELASLSDRDLESYEWGTHMDNAMTLMTRKGRFDLFKYLLIRGINPLAPNNDDLNAIHGVILEDKI